MREILFRGKRTDNGEWIYGDLIQNVNCVKIREQEKDVKHIAKSFEIDQETVGQFTCLTDKNGEKIFEGDIIKIPDDYDEFGINAGEIYDVYFAFGGFRLKPKYSKAKGFWLEDDKTVEVIGNIHDNSELLKGGEE